MSNLITFSCIAAYIFSFSCLLKNALAKRPGSTLFLTSFLICLVLHALFLQQSLFASNALNLSLANASSLVFFAIGVISAVALIRNLPIDNLIILYLPFAALAVFAASISPANSQKVITGEGLITHIVLSILSYSLITLAALQASVLAIQESQLRKHNFKGVFQYLPPLQNMEGLLFEMIWLGFITLGISIGTGFMFLQDMFAQHLAHKTILSIAAWLVFAVLLFGRHAWGWRGTTATKFTIAGFSALMLAYFGSKFVLEVLLR